MNKRKVAIGVSILVLIVGAGIALAAFLLRADINGGGNVVAAPSIQFAAVGTEVLPTTNLAVGSCTVSVNGGGTATVTMTDIIQGEACDVAFAVDRNGGGASVVKAQDVEFSDVTDDRFINNSCGVEFPEATNQAVHVRFLVPTDAPIGTFTATLTGSDLVAVNAAAYVAADCPSF